MADPEKPFYQIAAEKALEVLQTAPEGLSPVQAGERLKEFGPNELTLRRKASAAVLLIKQFLNPLVYLLLIAAGIKFFFKGLLDAASILIAIFIMAGVGFIQEFRAEKAMGALLELTVPKAKVRRGGNATSVSSRDIVPGDILLLETGDKVPTDARLIENFELKVNESALTGEPIPVDKHTAVLANELTLADRKNMVFMGTVVTYGRAIAVVTATGMQTEIGKISSALHQIKTQKTPLQRSIHALGNSLLGIVLFAVVLLKIIGLSRGMDWLDVFLLAVAAAVSAIPEGLPAVVTVVLAAGMSKMAQRNAVARNLAAVETLGAATVICSDKTGTLTLNQMTVTKLYLEDRWMEVTGIGERTEGRFLHEERPIEPLSEPVLMKMLRASVLCNDAVFMADCQKGCILGDPTEGALLVLALKAGIRKESLDKTAPRIGEIPFQSERQYMATLHIDQDKKIICVKGAPEKILPLCGRVAYRGGSEPLEQKARERIVKAQEAMANEAMRVLAVAYAEDYPGGAERFTEQDFLGRLVFVGLFGMIDPPREEAKKAIAVCRKAGVRVLMATGDNKDTARAIGAQLEIPSAEVISGVELAAMKDEDLDRKIEEASIFARIEPLHKLRIVEALKRRSHVVAMTGDGVNDAPALEAADIGISMGITGTDVAKEASDVVLADDNFASIVAAVEEGRVIFNRLRNAIFFQLTTCFGELCALMLTVLFLGEAPLLPIQILWVNLVTGAMLAIPLGLEPKTGSELLHPPRDPKVGLIYPGMLMRIFFLSGMLALGVFAIFSWALRSYDLAEARMIAFCGIVVFEWFVALNARSDEITIFRLGLFKNRALLFSILVAIGLQLAVVYWPPLRAVFYAVPLNLTEWGMAIAPGLAIFLIETFRKILFPRLFNRGKWR
ncbi:MAG: cation-translocating P-type ATPase [Candidatus Omnitrophota bacterium]